MSEQNPIQAWKETRREIEELEALRRRSEIRKLKEELGELPDARKVTKENT